MEIAGIAISEGRLLGINILFTVLLLVCVAGFVVVLYVFRDEERKKAKERLRQLKAKSNKGPSTDRSIRKLENKMKRNQEDCMTAALVYGLCILMIVSNVAFLTVPGWTDYARKDYAVYEGSFTCEFRGKNMCVVLDDGTVLTGGFGVDEGTYYGKVVYAKRAKITLGGRA